MGTRNLTAVVLGKKFVLAQYGQWDGHPDGQGATALEFCRKRLKSYAGREAFKDRLARVKFYVDGEIKKIAEEATGRTDGFMNMDEAKKFHDAAPYINRDHGAKILQMVWDAKGEVKVNDESAFAADSLFCEYAYVIDLDKNVFEAFKGFNKRPLPKKDRFAGMERAKAGDGSESEYYPVRMVASWGLDDLPTKKQLCDAYGSDDEEG